MIAEQLTAARVFDLEQPRYAGAPIHPGHVPPGYQYLLHRHHEPGGPDARTSAAGVLISSDHSGTHIDALAHQAEHLILYGARQVDSKVQTGFGFTELGAETMLPMVGRGVLIDLVRHQMKQVAPARWIPLQEVQDAANAQAVKVRRGDVVLIRTGFGRLWNKPPDYLRAPGFSGEVSQWLADAGVRAVGADNMAWDWLEGVSPVTNTSLPGHVILLARAGIHILENLFLEELGETGLNEFGFVCLPLKLQGATGSPVRPIALVG